MELVQICISICVRIRLEMLIFKALISALTMIVDPLRDPNPDPKKTVPTNQERVSDPPQKKGSKQKKGKKSKSDRKTLKPDPQLCNIGLMLDSIMVLILDGILKHIAHV